jgi:hypothetical protein
MTEIKKAVSKLNQFGSKFGIPIVAGVAGFAVGDGLGVKALISSKISARQVTIVGFSFDVAAWMTIFVYAALAIAGSRLAAMAHPMAGRAVFAYFLGSVLKLFVDMFQISTAGIVSVE